MRPSYVLLLLVLAVGGGLGYRHYERSQLPPFALWGIRPGTPFETLDAEAARGLNRHYACKDFGGRIRLCEVETDGPPGLLRLVVDGAGRAAMVQLLVRDTTLKLREEGRQIAAEWSLARPPRPPRRGLATVTDWVSEDGAWSASIHYNKDTELAEVISLVDERRLARTVDANPHVLLRLAAAGFLDGDALDSAFAHVAPHALAPAVAVVSSRGRDLAAAAAVLPRCPPPKVGDVVPAHGPGYDRLGPDARAVAEQAVARAYPGMHLELADRPYLVDGEGKAEAIDLAASSGSGVTALAVNFPRRVALAQRSLGLFDVNALRCRAEAELLLVRRDPTTGAVVAVRRLDVDGEAHASQISSVEAGAGPAAGAPVVTVNYDALYGTRGWTGQVAWTATFAFDTAGGEPRALGRVPIGFAKKDPAARESTGLSLPEEKSPAGFLRFSVLRLTPAGSPPGQLILPQGPSGLTSGWMLLDLL